MATLGILTGYDVSGYREYTQTWQNFVRSDDWRESDGPVANSSVALERWGGRRVDVATVEFDSDESLMLFLLRWS